MRTRLLQHYYRRVGSIDRGGGITGNSGTYCVLAPKGGVRERVRVVTGGRIGSSEPSSRTMQGSWVRAAGRALHQGGRCSDLKEPSPSHNCKDERNGRCGESHSRGSPVDQHIRASSSTLRHTASLRRAEGKTSRSRSVQIHTVIPKAGIDSTRSSHYTTRS